MPFLITHAHLDHCGFLPVVVREGFSGPVYLTRATAELAGLVLLDSAKVQREQARSREQRARRLARRASHRAERAPPSSPGRRPGRTRRQRGRAPVPAAGHRHPRPRAALRRRGLGIGHRALPARRVRQPRGGGAGHPGDVLGRRTHPGLGHHHARRGGGWSAGPPPGLLGGPRPARHAHHPRPDPGDRWGRLRDHGVDLRRPRARTGR